MGKKVKTGSLMIVIAFLCAWLGLPLEWLTPQGQLYRNRADRLSVRAAGYRDLERQARSKGDLAGAERSRLRAAGLERQAWAYRKASWSQWKWPELRPGGPRPVVDD